MSEVLSEFARTMLTAFPIQAILDRLVERIVEILPVSAAGVTFSPGAEPRYVAASDRSALRYEQLQTELDEGPCVLAYQTGEAVTVADLRNEDRFPSFSPRALEAGLRAVFTFPLRHGDLQLGALDLYRDTPGGLSMPTVKAAQTLADVAAAYLLNAQARDDLEDSSQRSREAALHDALTGLPNRVLLLERLDHALHRAQRSHKTSAVVYLDVDRFKIINDAYGHQIGDELLVAVAQRLAGQLRPGDTLARLSGDEFVVLCEDLDTPAQAASIAARLARTLRQPFVLSAMALDITASVGVAFAKRGDYNPKQLLHDADMAMYQVKRRGGGYHQILDCGAQNLIDHQANLARDLRGATGRGELHLDYQPVVDAADRRVIGVEALLRWAHSGRGLIAPATVIPIAEHTGLISEIGRWVLETAWADRQRWTTPGPADNLTMAVNVSAHQLMTSGFANLVASALQQRDTNPNLLTLEFTESVFVRVSERAMIVLHDLKDIGVTLAFDDFGTGYSSLAYLERFPIDIVKIDRVVIARLGHSSASKVIVNAVIQLAHGLNMTVVAEGIETAEQHLRLSLLGCDSCQGNYFAHPMNPTDLDTLIDRHMTNTDLRLPSSLDAE